MLLQVRPLDFADIPWVANFPPEDWNFDFKAMLRFHLGYDYFYPLVGTLDGRPVAVGHGIRHDGIAWLGNVIVLAGHRGRGFGSTLTAHLVDFMQTIGCQTQVLIATQMGEPIYRKLGFRVTGKYAFFNGVPVLGGNLDPKIGLLEPKDHTAVLDLDRRATGECREKFLARHLSAGLVYRDLSGSAIRACYLPSLGTGSIISADPEAGRAMVRMKITHAVGPVVIPDANQEAKALLEACGLIEYASAPRMTLGPEPDWRPNMIWNRAAGYCG